MFFVTHLILCLSSIPILFIIPIIYKGMIWLVLPILMIAFNDIFAYLFGITLGKTPLIKLSPNKTWEGFFGGMVGTVIVAVLCTKYFT